MCYLDMYCLICKYLGIFQLSVTDFYFSPIVVSEQYVFYSFKSVRCAFMAQNMVQLQKNM